MRLSRFLIFICLYNAIHQVSAQETLTVDSKTMAEHALTHAYPSYPADARKAKVQGTVVLEAQIDIAGHVTSARPLSGEPMLVPAAISCLMKWTYRPFEKNGVAVPASGPVSFEFSMGGSPEPSQHTDQKTQAEVRFTKTITFPPADNKGQPDEAIANRFLPLWESCTRGVIAHRNDADTVLVCKQAAAVADEFPADRRYIERRRSYVYAATAIANTGDLKGGLPYAEKAVQVVTLGKDDDSGSEAAFSTRGQLRGLTGDLEGANQDLEAAEDYERKAIAIEERNSSGISSNYKGVLARDLRFHAETLKRLSRPEAAQAKLDEAAKLQ